MSNLDKIGFVHSAMGYFTNSIVNDKPGFKPAQSGNGYNDLNDLNKLLSKYKINVSLVDDKNPKKGFKINGNEYKYEDKGKDAH